MNNGPVARVLVLSFVAMGVLIGGVILGQVLGSNRQVKALDGMTRRLRGTESALNLTVAQLATIQKCVLDKGANDPSCRKLAAQPAPVVRIEGGGTTRIVFPGNASSSSSSSGGSGSGATPRPMPTPRPTPRATPHPTPKPKKCAVPAAPVCPPVPIP